jgi:hypothetical protein
MKNYSAYIRDIFLSLAVVYLLSLIGVALLCIWFIAKLPISHKVNLDI